MRAVLLLAIVAACATGRPATEPQPLAHSVAPAAAPDEAAEPSGTEASAPSAEAARPHRIHFDLARHPQRAELFEGDALVEDLGAGGGGRLSRGGWRSGFVRARVLDADVLVARGRQGRLSFAARRGADLHARLEGVSFSPGKTAVYLNGTELEPIELGTDGLSEVSVTLPGDALRDGENDLLLRASGSRAVPTLAGLGRVGLALRAFRVGPSPRGDAGPQALPSVAIVEDGVPALKLEGAWRATWVLQVPPEARLRALVRGVGRALVHVRPMSGAANERRELARVDATEAGAPLDVDLGALAGEVVRLELSAEATSPATAASTRWLRPAVVEPASAREAARRPVRNVLLVLVDTLRADKLAPYDPETRVRTPGLVAFTQQASTFLHAHTQENWTKPSVATLLSSLMPWEHNTTQHESVVPTSVKLLPELLRAQGFHTGAFIANGYVSDRFGFGRGWDSYRNYIREGRRTRGELVAADVLEWLDRRPTDKPFFLYVHTIDPHVPYRPPAEHLGLYGDTSYRGPVDFSRDATLLENIKLGRIRLAPRDRAHLEALYDGEITYTDVHFRGILDGLERRGLADDTLVVLTSDHGEEFWDHGSVGHGHSVWEELLHVPLFVRLPGEPARRLTDSVGLVDVMPTILEALGLERPAELSGRSFLPALRGEAGDAPQPTVSGFMDHWRTVNAGRWKLIVRPGHPLRLYDLANDPRETTDVAEQHPHLATWLRGELGLALDETRGAGASAPRPRPRHRAATTEIDPETAAQLRALGYLGN
ncbi:MAG: sulfatase [Myxococcales bacterium]|nr:sulfatase [Myxococcales bacterium]